MAQVRENALLARDTALVESKRDPYQEGTSEVNADAPDVAGSAAASDILLALIGEAISAGVYSPPDGDTTAEAGPAADETRHLAWGIEATRRRYRPARPG